MRARAWAVALVGRDLRPANHEVARSHTCASAGERTHARAGQGAPRTTSGARAGPAPAAESGSRKSECRGACVCVRACVTDQR